MKSLLSRRGFLALLSALAASGAALHVYRRRRNPPAALAPADSLDRAAFVAVVDTIVPADRDPGAVAAGVPEALLGDFVREPWRASEYRAVVRAVDAAAQERHGRAFAALEVEARTEILRQMLLDREHVDTRAYLSFLRVAVLRRFYSSPPGQEMLGYRPPRLGYADYHRPPA